MTVFHGMECQSVEVWETAPAEDSAVICNASLIGSSSSLVHPHRREVSSLARRVMLQPVSVPLQDGLRFFPPPYPHRHQWALRLSYLSYDRSDMGLPRSTRLTRTGEVLSLRRERWMSMTGYYRDPVPAPVPFWPKPGSIFGLLLITTFIKSSHVSPYHPSGPVSA